MPCQGKPKSSFFMEMNKGTDVSDSINNIMSGEEKE